MHSLIGEFNLISFAAFCSSWMLLGKKTLSPEKDRHLFGVILVGNKVEIHCKFGKALNSSSFTIKNKDVFMCTKFCLVV